jgi:putative nucleotidyltransferase with HDIG domain
MRLADAAGLPVEERPSLFYALLMKDLGCSSNAARFAALFGADDHDLKSNLKMVDWSQALESFKYVSQNVAPGRFWLQRVWRMLAVLSRGPEGAREVVRTRCERGADIARLLGFEDETVEAIRALDEHWDGRGQPYALRRDQIPLLGRFLCLSQTFEVFFSSYGLVRAYDMAISRRGSWFDPALVDALKSMQGDTPFWEHLALGDELQQLKAVEPPDRVMTADEDHLDLVAEAFARVIDAKSPWTYQHSTGVADIAIAIGRTLGFNAADLRELRRAALLHDLGKLGVSSLILDKPGKLTDHELAIMRRHPGYTHEILSQVGCFRHFADLAAAHHERLDGRGYHRQWNETQLVRPARILCVADICDALRASRPYRAGLPVERVLEIMGREAGAGIDPDCFSALRQVIDRTVGVVPTDVPAVRLVPALAEDYNQAA